MIINLPAAKKLRELLTSGKPVPVSELPQAIFRELIEEQVVTVVQSGRTKRSVYVHNKEAVTNYLRNKKGIPDIDEYIRHLEDPEQLRADAIAVSANSKLTRKRTFKGFLINVVSPITGKLNGKPLNICPEAGTFIYIYDYAQFEIATDVRIVGIENPEVFRYPDRLPDYLQVKDVLFVCRYPYSSDLITWLKGIKNEYVHFGDFDWEGMNIYLDEYKSKLGEKASLLIPDDLDDCMKNGSSGLYNEQYNHRKKLSDINDPGAVKLYELLLKHRKGLEQEIYLVNR